MFENLDVFQMSSALAKHAGQRQALIAQNVANADTPEYVSRDLPDFKNSYLPAQDAGVQRATRAGHLHGAVAGQMAAEPVQIRDQASPNGNEVSLESEMLKSTDAKRAHDRALAIYKSSLGILRSTIRT